MLSQAPLEAQLPSPVAAPEMTRTGMDDPEVPPVKNSMELSDMWTSAATSSPRESVASMSGHGAKAFSSVRNVRTGSTW